MVVRNQFICCGCDQPITDRYILQVDNQKWHYGCLRCSHCKCALNDKCWHRQGNFYCKDDYLRLVQLISTCTVCKKPIEKNTLKHTFYNINVHLNCFQCDECGKTLNSGDHFYVISSDKFACSIHYNQKYLKVNSKEKKLKTNSSNQSNSLTFNNLSNYQEPAFKNSLTDHHLNKNLNNNSSTDLDQHNLNDNSANLIDYSNDFNYLNANVNEFSSIGNELPASDSSSTDNYWTQIDFNFSNENENHQKRKSKLKGKKLQTNKNDSVFNHFETTNEHEQDSIAKQFDLISSPSNVRNSPSTSSSVNSDFSNSTNSSTNFNTKISTIKNNKNRIKRIRTSFKPFQLKALRNYFAINQTPTSKEVEELQEIGLSKRTVQIWFQNRRAKWRKTHNKYLIDQQALTPLGQTYLDSPADSTTNRRNQSSNEELSDNDSILLDRPHSSTMEFSTQLTNFLF